MRGAYDHIDDDVLIRISYLLGIYKALYILLTDPVQAEGWIRRPNVAPMFAGDTVLKFLCRGGLSELRRQGCRRLANASPVRDERIANLEQRGP